ncbi:MAG: DUF3552 domain-containing protein, partial [Myxococcales bacterium]|nr:DUF3552 domain-containing protein [Myxococcales bacterium]
MNALMLFAMIAFSSVLTAGLCLVGFVVLRRRMADDRVIGAETRSGRIIDQAHRAAGSIRADAETLAANEVQRRREKLEQELADRRDSLDRDEYRIAKAEEKVAKEQTRLERRLQEVEGREREAGRAEKRLQEAEDRYARLVEEVRAKLQEIGGLTADQAKQRIVDEIVDEARQEATRRVWEIEAETKEEAEKRAKRILGLAIQRYAGEYVAERTVSVVALPNDDMKGRII